MAQVNYLADFAHSYVKALFILNLHKAAITKAKSMCSHFGEAESIEKRCQ